MKTLSAHFFSIAVLSAFLCSLSFATDGPTFPTQLYKALSKDQRGNNFVYSPYSVSQAFRLAAFGAKSETLKQIESTLNLHDTASIAKNSDSVFVANRIWIQSGFQLEESYLNQCKTELGASPGSLDFKKDPKQSEKTINQWVEDQTHQKIKDLIPPGTLNESSRLVLTNAIYFKAQWEFPFTHDQTFGDDFRLLSGKSVSTPFMHQGKKLSYAEDKEVQVLRLPYANSDGARYAMVIVLPKEKVKLSDVEKIFSPLKIAKWEKDLQPTEVDVALPQFKFDSSFLLNDPLKKIGVRVPFDSKEADFSGIDGKKDLFIGQVFHKAFLKLDEEGTEAAAATAITMMKGMAMVQRKAIDFSAKRPFIFYIEDLQSNTILFLGRLTNPKSA